MSSARIFFAGVGTTFAILVLGFGGGLMFSKSIWPERPAQSRTVAEQVSGIRVVLPASAEPAPQPIPVSAAAPESAAVIQPAPAIQAPIERQVEKADTRRAERAERRKRSAERRARETARAREAQRQNPPVMAFGGDFLSN